MAKTKTEFESSFISLLNEILILSFWKIYPNKSALEKCAPPVLKAGSSGIRNKKLLGSR